jgi:transcriptional regulator GlxA family with amidase domain
MSSDSLQLRISTAPTRDVVFIAYPRMSLLDLSGAQTVFWAASRALAERGQPGYQLHTASLAGGLVHTVEGLAVDTRALRELDIAALDTLVVPGAPGHLPDPR